LSSSGDVFLSVVSSRRNIGCRAYLAAGWIDVHTSVLPTDSHVDSFGF
jgi:hypothetical protein